MIKKLLNKIMENLFGKKIEQNNECPYKVEPSAVAKKEDKPVEEVNLEIEDTTLKCDHCKEELIGKESIKDEDGAYYIWCNKCNYVNKVKDNKVIRKSNSVEEVMKAFKLFKAIGENPGSYSLTKDGQSKSF